MNIIHLEDNPNDAELVRRRLEAEWPELRIQLTRSREDFMAALQRAEPVDLILSDFSLPSFNGTDALALARQYRSDTPFIFVSGTIGEETAVESVRLGAADYLLKDRMQRLPLAIRRALSDNEERRRRRGYEQRLREQAELLDKVQDAIIVTNLQNRIVYWNQGAERLFGWRLAEAAGRTVGELFGPSAAAASQDLDRRLADDREWRSEVTLENKAKQPLLGEVRVTVVHDALGRPQSRLMIVTDITQRKRLEEQLLRAQRLESLGMLAAGIAHDLNNALAPMLMVGGLLRTRITDPGDLRLVELLEQSAERGAALVKQIVSFAGGRGRGRVVLQVNHIVREIVQLMRDTLPKSIRVEHAIAGDLWAVRGDPTQLHQVLLNLCINARDAMPNGGVLTIAARNDAVTEQSARRQPGATPGRFVVMEVADAGTGMSAETLAQIWQPFFTTKPEGHGTGLGLSTVRGIVAAHGGFATVQSREGHGTTFAVYLPVEENDGSGGLEAGTVRKSVARGRGELVFVVDDQVSVRESIAVVLAQHGYRPLTIADGIEALSKYADRISDVALVITDMDMPGLNGTTFGQAMLHLNSALKVLFISGTGDGSAPRAPAGSPPTAFLAKPFSPEALLAKVDELLRAERG